MPKLSQMSIRNLAGINPLLVKLCETAIKDTPVDFRITEGLRTLARQKHLLKIGASNTLDSKHLVGDAVDLVPWDGGPRWEWPLIFQLMAYVRKIALQQNVIIRWGGVWDVYNFTNTTTSPEALVNAYVARQKAKGKKAFIDGPHIELFNKRV